jgi:hypothetical protein
MKQLRLLSPCARRWRRRVPCMLGSALLVACGGDEKVDPNQLLDTALACGSIQDQACDVFDPACRDQIAAIAACQWGGPNTPVVLPEVMTLTQDEYRQLLTSDASTGADQDSNASDATTAVDHVLSLLGLIQSGDLSVDAGVDRQVEGVLAYYDFDSKTITIIGRSDAADPVVADSTLFHELIHAHQDAAHNLTAFVSQFPGTADSVATSQSLYEGEAQFHEWIYQIGLQHLSLDANDFESGLLRIQSGWEQQVLRDPSALLESLQGLPYNYGPLWIESLWRDGGTGAIQQRYARPPRNFLEVLDSAWSVPPVKPDVMPFPFAYVFAPNGASVYMNSQYVPIATDRLGSWTVYVAAHLFGAGSDAQQLSAGWQGDQIDVYRLDAGGYGGRWRVSFDSADHAQRFAGLFAQNPSVHLRVNGVTAVVIVSDSPDPEDWLYGPFMR